MMTVFRIIKITAVFMLALIVLLLLSLWFINFGFLKPQVETTVRELTGREFRIEGAMSLRILPTPTLRVENVRFANAEWGSDPDMLTLDTASVEVNLLSLLSQPIVIERVEVTNLSLLAETGPDEQANWVFAVEQEPAVEAGSDVALTGMSIPVVVTSGDISDLHITYRQPDTKDQVFKVDSLTATGEDGTTTLLNGKAQYTDLPVLINAAVSEHHVDADIRIDQVDISSQLDFPADAFSFDVTIKTLAKVGALLDIDGLPDESLALQGSVAFSDEGISFQDIAAAINGIELTADGKRDNESGIITLTTQVTGERLDQIDPGLPLLPFTLKGEVKIDHTRIDISTYQTTVGDSDMSGSAQIDAGDSLRVVAQLASKKIDLSPFLPQAEPSSETTASKTKNTESADAVPPSPYVFDESPLPLDVLQSLNLKLDAEIDQFKLHDADIRQIKIDADVHDGNLKITNSFDGYLSGHFENTVSITTSGKQAEVQLDTKIRNIRIIALSGAAVPKEQIPVTNLDIRLNSSGASARTLAANLDGGVVVNQGAGKVSNDLIQRFSGDVVSQLFSALNPFSEKQEFTNWQCSLFALTFESGFGEIEGFLLQSDQLMVVGGGDIDLNDESLNIEFNTKPRTGVGVSADMFVTPFVKLGGTLAKPSVGLNNKGVLLSGGAAVLTGGMSFLYTGIMDRATASFDRCDEARAAIKEVAKDVKKQAEENTP